MPSADPHSSLCSCLLCRTSLSELQPSASVNSMCFPQFRVTAWFCLDSPSLHCSLENLSGQWAGAVTGLTFFVFLSRGLLSSAYSVDVQWQKTLSNFFSSHCYNIFPVLLFQLHGKYGPCHSILARSRSLTISFCVCACEKIFLITNSISLEI